MCEWLSQIAHPVRSSVTNFHCGSTDAVQDPCALLLTQTTTLQHGHEGIRQAAAPRFPCHVLLQLEVEYVAQHSQLKRMPGRYAGSAVVLLCTREPAPTAGLDQTKRTNSGTTPDILDQYLYRLCCGYFEVNC